jgi:hypothetical protein
MLRTIHLIFQNEFRLLIKDRVGLFMLILAPVIIIAVAGFSLSNLYGVRAGDQAYSIPVVDQDGGEVASAIIDALKHEPMVAPTLAPTLDDARRVVTGRARAPLAIVIPAGTTEALKAGRAAPLILYVDPIKRLEVSAIELRLSDMCRAITSQAQDQARKKIASEGGELHGRLDRLGGRLKQLQAQIEHFRDQNDGAYVFFTSTSGLLGNIGQTNYGAAKMGIAAFTIIASRELRRYGGDLQYVGGPIPEGDAESGGQQNRKDEHPKESFGLAHKFQEPDQRQLRKRMVHPGSRTRMFADGLARPDIGDCGNVTHRANAVLSG